MLLQQLSEQGFFELSLDVKKNVRVTPLQALMLVAKHFGYDYVESDFVDETNRRVYTFSVFRNGTPMSSSDPTGCGACVKLINRIFDKEVDK